MGYKKKRKIKKIIVLTILIFGSLLMITPFAFMLSTAFKTQAEIYSIPMVWIPKSFSFKNFSDALNFMPIFKYMLNTIFIAGSKIVGEVFISAAIAFGFARFKFKGKDVIFIIVLATMMIPYEAVMIPTYVMWAKIQEFTNIQTIDTYIPLILPAFFGAPAFIFFLRMYFQTIPKDIEEAALIDGKNYFQIFFGIFIPMAKPALITISLWAFIGTWNDLLGQLIYIHSESKFTIQLALAAFSSPTNGEVLWGPLMAASTLALLPVMLLLLFAQNYFTDGIKMSGVK